MEAAAAQTSSSTCSEALASPARGRPLLNGGTRVEEDALLAALHTLEASRGGQLLSRRSLVYACEDQLAYAYARCGEVTEDYGRTFYLGAPRSCATGSPAAGWPRSEKQGLRASGPHAPPRSPASHAARSDAATQLMTEERRKAIWAIYGAPAQPRKA
jgi:hypothetical protein